MPESRSFPGQVAGYHGSGVAFAGVAGDPPGEEAFQPLGCVANIGPRQRRMRLHFGLGALSVGALAAVALVVFRVDVWWRLLLFLPFAAGGAGYFQAADHTWVSLAARGTRDMDQGVETIADAAERAQVHRQARRVQLKAGLLALLLTALCLLLPRG